MQIPDSVSVVRNTAPLSMVRRSVLPLVLIVSLFFLWGVANNLNDILIRQFKKAFELTDFESGLVQSAFYLGYFIFAIPAALFMRRFGYKGGIVLGLVLYAAGAFLFVPAAHAHVYGLFLLALFVVASGLSFLETSANPFITVLGEAETAERRLNLAQAFNPLGSITGVLIGRFFIFSGIEHTGPQLAAMPAGARAAYFAAESAAVKTPYLAIGVIVVLLAILIGFTRFPIPVEAPDTGASAPAPWRSLFRRRRFVAAVIAQFFYVGAQVGIWSYLIRYAQSTMPGTAEKSAADFLISSLILFMLGRFSGAVLMRSISPAKVLAAYALINTILASVAIGLPGPFGLYALIAASFFMSIMFPTIFALGLRGLGETRKLASSILVMSIVGGAILTPLMGAVSGYAGIHWSMAVPLCCFVIVLSFAALAGAPLESD
jgi:MFS transporter, FHS family, L-fucose permease